MRSYVIISAGRRAEEAVPVVSSSDPGMVDATLQAICPLLRASDEADDPAPVPQQHGEADRTAGRKVG